MFKVKWMAVEREEKCKYAKDQADLELIDESEYDFAKSGNAFSARFYSTFSRFFGPW